MHCGLAQIPGLTIYGVKNADSPNFTRKGGVIIFSLKSIMPNRVAKELAKRSGIGVRYGCHCTHMLIKHLLNVPPKLEKFQGMLLTVFPQIALPGVTRVSFGIENSKTDVDTLIEVLDKIARQTKIPKTNVKKQMDEFKIALAQRVYSHR
jgi:selenocysteine lyase/cysteine desulfurase